MKSEMILTSVRLRAPQAAAIAGILFAILLIISFLFLRHAVPAGGATSTIRYQT